MTDFPKEYEFKRAYENCEYWLEMKLLGWSWRPLNDIPTYWNLESLVNDFIRRVKHPDLRCPKPTEGSPDVVLEMKKLSPYYGSLYVRFKNMWHQKYKERKPENEQ